MKIVMNVVRVAPDNQEEFERQFLQGGGHVQEAPGFAGFELLRREHEGELEYLVTSRWESEEAFRAWVGSDLFKQSHKHAKGELAHASEVRSYDLIDAKVAA